MRFMLCLLLSAVFFLSGVPAYGGERDCLTREIEILCIPEGGDGSYVVSMDIVNDSGYYVTQLVVPAALGGIYVSFSNDMNSKPVSLPDNSSEASVQLILDGGNVGDRICIPIGLLAIDAENGDLFECCGAEVCVELPDCAPPGEELFVRGDVNSDSTINMTDGVAPLLFLFTGGAAPVCMDAADANDTGTVNISDPILIFNWLFLGGASPLPPTPSTPGYSQNDCGIDPTNDGLDCSQESVTCA
jgi:hypothetical protein